MIPMTEITPEDLRVKAESMTDPVVAKMLTEAADCIESLRSENATLRDEHDYLNGLSVTAMTEVARLKQVRG